MIGTAAVNGTELRYEIAGAGPPIVLIHGMALDLRTWDRQFEAFARDHCVIRYDLRGFGRSAIPVERFRHADDLWSLLEHLEIGPVHVAGLSMGGRIALQYAALYPDTVLSLVLADPALDWTQWSEEFNAAFEAVTKCARENGVAAAADLWLENPLFVQALENPQSRAHLERMVRDYSGWDWLNDSLERGIKPRAYERLGEMTAPALVIVGEKDIPDFQRTALAVSEGITGARKVVINGSGHLTNMEKPAEFNSFVLDFLHGSRS